MTNIVKDLQERNHLVRWGILIGLTFFSLATLFILAIDFKILRDPDIIQDHHFRILLSHVTRLTFKPYF
ncbi:hypothetical protein PsalN5692_00744 [Piscirickettsia salmonis]|uniref:hypothetical protein n=1 Tax=Piscirickettsia salmonis TaxID=1238 RepID=UPI0012B78123|nr:hypothetical protein [Piscirickettsia salmonis]QGP49315.1 hypothetical protein PsalN5692_00744 [Piscirickettsia salmonis]